jgi:hypothetical protein
MVDSGQMVPDNKTRALAFIDVILDNDMRVILMKDENL